MRNLFFVSLLTIVCGSVNAQSNTTQVKYNKETQPGLELHLPYGEKVAEGTIVQKLRATGYDPESKGKLFWKSNKVDGYYVFKDVMLEGSTQPMDLYFKVDGRKKQRSTIYLLAAKGEGNFVSPEDTSFSAAQLFLNNFVTETASYKLDLDIKGQQEAVSDAEKRLSRLKENERETERKIEELQNELKKNREDQEKQAAAIEEERRKLEELRNKKQTM